LADLSGCIMDVDSKILMMGVDSGDCHDRRGFGGILHLTWIQMILTMAVDSCDLSIGRGFKDSHNRSIFRPVALTLTPIPRPGYV
jgi:hypothetical protein